MSSEHHPTPPAPHSVPPADARRAMRNARIRVLFMGLAALVAVLTVLMHTHIGRGTHLVLRELFSLDWTEQNTHPKAALGGNVRILMEEKSHREPVVLPVLENQGTHQHSHDHNQQVRFMFRESNLGAPAFVGRNILDMGGGADVYGKQGRGASVIDHLGNLSLPAWTSASNNSIAVGLALTTRRQGVMTADNLQTDLPFFKGLLSSFCFTASAGYDYHFYIGHDHDDPFFATEMSHQVFELAFYNLVAKSCPNVFNVSLHLVECNHTGRPAWAQNDAMMAAYMDNMEYYYRVNDDTIMESSGWTEKLIEELERYQPRRVGVVGPWFKEGNYNILTHDFVHRTHIDIFGYYYPRVFTDWFADNWITGVYSPKRCRKAPGTRVKHTMEQGSRYVIHFDKAEKVNVEVEIGKGIIERWLANRAKAELVSSNMARNDTAKNIISMSLYGTDIDKLYGAMRYTQLASVMYPNWRVRFYVQNVTAEDRRVSKVLRIVVRKLELSGSEIIRLDEQTSSRLPPAMWRLLALGDTSIERVLIRDADTRPSEREAMVLADWLRTTSPWHCVRDHPRHAAMASVPSLVGGIPGQLSKLLPASWQDVMAGYTSDAEFIQEVFWPRVEAHSLCHDSVSCLQWSGSQPFPVLRKDSVYVGQHYDANDEVLDPADTMTWDPKYTSPDCAFLKSTGFSEAAVKAVIRHRPVFWSQDYHVTPIMDIRSLLAPIGLRVIDKSMSFYCRSTGTCAQDLRVITRENGMSLTPKLVESFYEAYRNDTEMSQVTTFVCTLPVSMCEAFLPFHKSMLVIATLRYEQSKHEASQWLAFNKLLVNIASGQNNVVAANNEYDARYIEYFTGLKPVLIPNYCAYLSDSYTGKRREFLVTPIHSTELYDQFFADFDNAVLQHGVGDLTIFPLREMYPQYQFSDIAAHPGIIYVPYQVSMVSLTEQYRMNIPLFFPSLDLLTRWHLKHQVIRQRTWDGYYMRQANGSVIAGLQKDIPDPNNDNEEEAVRYWLQYADYYRWPHIVYFDSVDDLVVKLSTVNLTEISENMKQHNTRARQYIKRTWSRVLLKLIDGHLYDL